jgi:hypothetical protein
MSLVEDAFAEDAGRVPPGIRKSVAQIARAAFGRGRLDDRRVALEVAGAAPQDQLVQLIRSAIAFGKRYLDTQAYPSRSPALTDTESAIPR